MKNGKGTDRFELPAEFLRQKFLDPRFINFRLRAESGNVPTAQCNKGLWLRRRLVEPAGLLVLGGGRVEAQEVDSFERYIILG